MNGATSQVRESQLSPTTNLLQLNDDVYFIIFENLPNFCDRASLANAATRLYTAFQLWAEGRRNVFDADDAYNMSPQYIASIFRLAGPYISAVRMHCFLAEQQGIPQCIHDYCPELKELILLVDHDGFCCQSMLQNMQSLHKIVICCQSAREELDYNLRKNTDLATVEIKCGYYSGKNLVNQTSLRNLILRDCNLWCDRKFGRSIRNLTSLVLLDCVIRDTDVYSVIARNCAELEELTFSVENSNYSVIAQLPKLRRLTVSPEYFERDLKLNFLQALVDKKADQLQYLKLDGDFDITDEHARMLGQLRALQQLAWHDNDTVRPQQLTLYFCHLEQLEVLSFEQCAHITLGELENNGLRAKFPNLRKLIVKNCGLLRETRDNWTGSSSPLNTESSIASSLRLATESSSTATTTSQTSPRQSVSPSAALE